MLSQDGIQKFTNQVIPYLHVTTRIPGKKYDNLLRKNGFGGFPTLAFMDAEGKVLTKLHYSKRSLEGFAESLKNVSRLQDLRARAASDPQAAIDLLLLEMEMKTLRFEAAKERAKGLDFTPAERLVYEAALVETLSRLSLEKAKAAVATLDLQAGPGARARAILGDLEIRKELRPILRRYRPGVDPDPPYHLAYGLFRKGRLPSDKPHVDTLYWTSLSRAAFKVKDVKAFEAALDHLRPAIAKTNASWLKSLEDKLVALKKTNDKN